MGIPLLNKLIEEHGGGFNKCALSDYKKRRIGIDAPAWAYRTYAIAHKKVYLDPKLDLSVKDPEEKEIQIKILNEWFKNHISKFLMIFFRNDVVPMFIFDGTARPEKEKVRETRKKGKEEKTKKLEKDRADLDSKDILLRDEDDIENYRKAKAAHPHHNYRALRAFRKILDALGLPWAVAKHDAEQLCSILNIEGYTAATWTTDTDALTFGSSTVLMSREKELSFEDGIATPIFNCVHLDNVLKNLKLSFPEFVDMCILASCDYNEGIDKISTKRAYQIIKEYGSIDDVPQSRPGYLSNQEIRKLEGFGNLPYAAEFRLENLDHFRCRNIFQFVPSESFTSEGDLNVRPTDNEELIKLCEKYSITMSFTGLIREKERLSAPENNDHRYFFIL